MNQLSRPSYKRGPVRTLAKLADVLEITEAQLRSLASNASAMYHHCPQLKKDGTARDTWDAHPQLKKLHELVNRRFLRLVEFPLYLQGGIRDRAVPRDYVGHVAIHAGAECAIALDIADFFPSITEAKVFDIWRSFFRFSEEVADTLTKLTTKDGKPPQGAKTSNYLANLVFWRSEHELVRRLHSLGWRYSRLTDDVTVSKLAHPTPREEAKICSTVIGLIHREGFVIKRSKLKVHRQNRPMTLNGLVANVRPALPKAERNKIRAEVDSLAHHLGQEKNPDKPLVRRTLGRLAKLSRFHQGKASSLKSGLPGNVYQLVVERSRKKRSN